MSKAKAITAEVEEYTADTLERIWADVQKLQNGFYSRRLTREDIYKALQPVIARPYGQTTLDAHCGGRKAPKRGKKTLLQIWWYSWRRQKYIKWSCRRTLITPEDDQKPTKITEASLQYATWYEVFPDRVNAYESIMLKRRLTRKGYVLPPDITNLYLYDERYGMVLVFSRNTEGEYGTYLCSPLGYFKVMPYTTRVYKAAKQLGIQLPRDTKKRVWENIEPAWVMRAVQDL